MLNGDAVQRLSSHMARIAPQAKIILHDAMARVRDQHPAVGVAFPLATPAQQFRAMEALAAVAKNVNDLGALQPWLNSVGAHCAACNLSRAPMPSVQAAFLGAIRSRSGEDWNQQLDHDWYALLTAVFGFIAQAMPSRTAVHDNAAADDTAFFTRPHAVQTARAAA